MAGTIKYRVGRRAPSFLVCLSSAKNSITVCVARRAVAVVVAVVCFVHRGFFLTVCRILVLLDYLLYCLINLYGIFSLFSLSFSRLFLSYVSGFVSCSSVPIGICVYLKLLLFILSCCRLSVIARPFKTQSLCFPRCAKQLQDKIATPPKQPNKYNEKKKKNAGCGVLSWQKTLACVVK